MQKHTHARAALGIVPGVVLVGLMAGCASPPPQRSSPVAQSVALPASVATSAPMSSGQPLTPSAAGPQATGGPQAPAASLPVSVQSDAAMRRAGNAGPSSSILTPTSCTLRGESLTAEGSYAGGLAPQVYPRYGDVIDLYAFTAPQAGYPDGIQLATPSTPQSPRIGGTGSWSVTVPVDRSLGRPARCVLAAQPTHDFQGAPSAY